MSFGVAGAEDCTLDESKGTAEAPCAKEGSENSEPSSQPQILNFLWSYSKKPFALLPILQASVHSKP